jgi:hypothetical protein
MAYMENIKNFLKPTKFYRSGGTTEADIKVHIRQLENIQGSNDFIEQQILVSTSTNAGLTPREQAYMLSSAGSIEDRRARLFAHEIGRRSASYPTVKAAIEVFGCQVIITCVYDKDYVIFYFDDGEPDNIEDIKDMLMETMPAHLGLIFKFKFRAWGEVKKYVCKWCIAKQHTWKWMLKFKPEDEGFQNKLVIDENNHVYYVGNGGNAKLIAINNIPYATRRICDGIGSTGCETGNA